jgi:hypothetical protein
VSVLFAMSFAAWLTIGYCVIMFTVVCIREKVPVFLAMPLLLRRDLPEKAIVYRRRSMIAFAVFLACAAAMFLSQIRPV